LNPKYDEFTSRGNITVNSINTGDININQKELNAKERNELIELAHSGSFYRVKAEVITSDGIKTTFLTSLKACHLLQSQLHDSFTLSLDHNNYIVGVSIRSINLDNVFDDCEGLSLNNINEFTTIVTLNPINEAPVPNTNDFIQKLEREREAKEKGQTQDNRSFLQKYWMYLIPAVIFLLISGATNPETQGAAAR
jgi:hypothetical protein